MSSIQLIKYLDTIFKYFVKCHFPNLIMCSSSCGFRFETVDITSRLLIPIIVLHNHNRYNIMEKGHNYSINIEAIEAEVSFSLCFRMSYVLHNNVVLWENYQIIGYACV